MNPREINDCKINSNFRNVISVIRAFNDNDLSEFIKIEILIDNFYIDMPKDKETAINDFLWFFRCGKEFKPSKKELKDIPYDFEIDEGLIFAAIMAQYGINIREIDYLHWWDFKAYFDSLTSEHLIVQVIGHRTKDLSKLKGAELKRTRELKEYWKIQYDNPIKLTLEQRDKKIIEETDRIAHERLKI